MKQWNIECSNCKKTDKFEDSRAIEMSKWIILAWDIKSGYPVCLCDKCKTTYFQKKNK